ncbi:MAG: PQQ-binding-like beta-propeller repeat protein [Thermoplasmata archaeon]
MWRGSPAGVAILLVLAVLAGVAQGQEEPVRVLVMFDLGGGFVYWEEIALDENRTGIKATEDAAGAADLSIEVSWSEFGAFVADIGDRDPVFPEYFHLLLWNDSAQDWGLSPVGASALTLQPGDTIGWFLSADDPNWDFVSPWPGPTPLATPTHPYPMVAFRGNLANTGATGSVVPKTPELRWQFDTGGGEIGASPVGAAGTLYQVTLFNGTYALDLETGAQRWRQEGVSGLSTPALYREAGFVTVPSLGTQSRPADLVVGSRDGALYRLDGGSGSVVWRSPLLEEPSFTGIASSPKVSKGRAFVGLFNETGGPGALVAMDLADGTIAWRHNTSSIHMSSPAVHRGSVYVGLMGLFNASSLSWDPPYGLLKVSEENGTEEWLFPTSGPVASSPVVSDAFGIYFTSRDGSFYGVSTSGALLESGRIGPSTSSPAMTQDVLYAASGVLGTEGNVTAQALGTDTTWQYSPNGPVQGSLTLASDVLLFATNTENGTLYALDASSGAVRWTYLPEPRQYILTTPVVIDGLVVLASDSGFIYALGPPESPQFDVGLGVLAATIVIFAGIVVGVALLVRAWRRRTIR